MSKENRGAQTKWVFTQHGRIPQGTSHPPILPPLTRGAGVGWRLSHMVESSIFTPLGKPSTGEESLLLRRDNPSWGSKPSGSPPRKPTGERVFFWGKTLMQQLLLWQKLYSDNPPQGNCSPPPWEKNLSQFHIKAPTLTRRREVWTPGELRGQEARKRWVWRGSVSTVPASRGYPSIEVSLLWILTVDMWK